MENKTRRKLAAIVSTDVVGYSRLMGADETGTLDALRAARRELIDPMIDRHGGRIVKTMGDGLLLEFSSAIAGVECALEIQDGLAARKAALGDGPQISLRIGVHIGDVIEEHGDVFGDGVNLAARLQEISDPAGVCISGAVHEQISGKVDHRFDDQGFRSLKNIDRPVRVYKARVPGARSEDAVQRQWPYVAGTPKRQPLASGGCLCGRVRFDVWDEAAAVGYCHCRMCQLALGAPLNAWAAFRKPDVTFSGDPPKIFKSSPIAERAFCAECGTSIYTEIKGGDGTEFYSIRLATLDNPEKFPPTCHFGVESQLPWLHIEDDLPRIRTEDDAVLSGLWASVGEPRSGPPPATAVERLQSRRRDPE